MGTSEGCCQRGSWSKKEIALLVCAIVGYTCFCFTIPFGLRKSIHRNLHYRLVHDGHHGGGGRHEDRGRWDPTRSMRLPPDMSSLRREFDEVECEVLDIEDSPEEVECTRNERGEWCAARGPVPQRRHRRDDHEEEDSHEERRSRGPGHEGRRGERPEHGGRTGEHHREGMSDRRLSKGKDGEERWHFGRRGDDPPPRPTAEPGLLPQLEEPGLIQRPPPPQEGQRRAFPCMRMRVGLHNRQQQTGLAHEDPTDVSNFPDCSFSSCEENAAENRRRLEETRRRWVAMRHHVTMCMVSKRNPSHVIVLTPRMDVHGLIRSCGFHSTFWTFAFATICALILCVLRCNKKKATQKRVVPEKLPGGAYLVTNQSTEGMSEKEKEAFGFSSPEVSDDLPSAPSKGFLMLAPPAYTEGVTVKPITLLTTPPPYLLTPPSPTKEEDPKKTLPLVE